MRIKPIIRGMVSTTLEVIVVRYNSTPKSLFNQPRGLIGEIFFSLKATILSRPQLNRKQLDVSEGVYIK